MDQLGLGRRVLRGLRRAVWVLASLGAIALTSRVAFAYALGPDAGAQQSSRPLRVLSYNIKGHAALVRADHLEAIARVIREQHPDVVALQEVHRGTWQARFRDQAAELGRLTDMSVAFGSSFAVL